MFDDNCRALVTTRPIDIVYTPALLHRMKEVFTVPSTSLYKSANACKQYAQFDLLDIRAFAYFILWTSVLVSS